MKVSSLTTLWHLNIIIRNAELAKKLWKNISGLQLLIGIPSAAQVAIHSDRNKNFPGMKAPMLCSAL